MVESNMIYEDVRGFEGLVVRKIVMVYIVMFGKFENPAPTIEMMPSVTETNMHEISLLLSERTE